MRRTLNRVLRIVFFGLIVRILILVVLGLSIRNRERLPSVGPAIIAANHNSHLDTLTLMSLFPLRDLARIRPVAAVDYFFKNRLLKWLALDVIGIIPIERNARVLGTNPLAACETALHRGEILILFPEGTRGEPEALAGFKKGVARLARSRPDVPVIPMFIYGLGRALPKGAMLLVPFACHVYVGEDLRWENSMADFMSSLEGRMRALAEQGSFPPWE